MSSNPKWITYTSVLHLTEPDIQFTTTSHSLEGDVLHRSSQIFLHYTDRIIIKIKKGDLGIYLMI